MIPFIPKRSRPDPPAVQEHTPRHALRASARPGRAGLILIATLAVLFALRAAQEVLIPLVLSVLISLALSPIVTALQRLRVPRTVGAAFVLIVIAAVLGGVSYGLRDNAAAWLDALPQAASKVQHALRGSGRGGAIAQVQRAASALERSTNDALRNPPAPGVARVEVVAPSFDLRDYLLWGTKSVAALVAQIVIVIFLVYVLLCSGDLYKRKLVHIAGPSLTRKRITLEILNGIEAQIERFLFVQLATAILVGISSWLVYTWIGLQNAAVWGVAAAVLSVIPYFGPLVVIVSATVVGFLQSESLGVGILVGIASTLVSGLEGHALVGWLTSRVSHMNAVAVFVGLLFGGWLWGVWGILLSMPLLVTIKVIAEHVEPWRPIAELLGE